MRDVDLSTWTHPDGTRYHFRDGKCYTKDEADELLDGKSDAGHTHDDRYYTEAEIDAMLSGNLVRLWKNSSPTSSFPAQTVNVDLTGFNMLYIEYKAIITSTFAAGAIDGDEHTLLLLAIQSTANTRNGTRVVTYDDSSVAFGNCTYNGEQTNTYCVPLAIYATNAATGGGGGGGGLPAGGSVGDVLMKTSLDGAGWVTPASSAEEDNTRPITSAAVYTEIGNINALLATI